jgi:hypothetical protein
VSARASAQRRPHALALVLALASCVYAPPPTPPIGPEVGTSHRPFCGVPYYLLPCERLEIVRALPTPSERQPVAGRSDRPTGERMQRARALLAAVDAHGYGTAGPPSTASIAALELTLDELGQLLAPYPELGEEVEELRRLAHALPQARTIDLPRLRARIAEITDLIRFQLVAAA